MEITPFKLFIYETEDGRKPYLEWFDELPDKKSKGVIQARLNRVRIGNLGDCKTVGGGVSELRVDFGPGFRIYFGMEGSEIVIILCGGLKRGQGRDIERAIEYWADYRRR